MKVLRTRWCVTTEDRIGMVRDIVSVIASHQGNVEAMEVVAQVLYIRFRSQTTETEHIRQDVLRIDGVKSVDRVAKLPFEADEARLVRRMMRLGDSDKDVSFAHLVHRSSAMGDMLRLASAVAEGSMPILIQGESGTGKELLARAIHQASLRRDGRFVPVNCAAMPDALMESEMFGYAEGSFTGASRGGRPGLFEVADGGTLFLDEVGELNLALQAKLLRALSDGEIRRVGSAQTTHVNVRIIAATNRDVRALVKAGQFRTDLYYRLNGMPLWIPPLRERPEDVEVLVEHFLAILSKQLERPLQCTPLALRKLKSYPFPGNVRELQNILERASVLAREGVIDTTDVWIQPAEQREDEVPNPSTTSRAATSIPNLMDLKSMVREYERQVIQEVVRDTGSLRAAARKLGVTHTTLSNKLKAIQDDQEE